jgi:hypothetical protein
MDGKCAWCGRQLIPDRANPWSHEIYKCPNPACEDRYINEKCSDPNCENEILIAVSSSENERALYYICTKCRMEINI